MWKEPYTYTADFLPLAAGTGVNFATSTIKIFENNQFELVSTIYQATDGRIKIKMTNASNGHDIIRPAGDIRAVSSSALSGITANGFTPYTLPTAYILGNGAELTIAAADASGSANRLRLALHGNKLMSGDAPYIGRKKTEIFSFTIDSGTIAAYDAVTVPFIIDSSWGFLCSKLTGASTSTGLCFIQDIAPWSNNDIHFYNMVGNSQFGNNLTSRRWIPEKSKLSVRFTDLSGSANRMRITFHGERVYA